MEKSTETLKKIMFITPEEFQEHKTPIELLQDHLDQYISLHRITREEICSKCEITIWQFYRRMKKPQQWEISNLLKIIELANNK